MDIARDSIPGFTLAGAVVRRAFSMRGSRVMGGTVLSADAFMAIGYAVRRIFVRDGQITPIYAPESALPPPQGQAHIIHRGGGRYDVIVGTALNDEPLSKDEAESIAARVAQ